MKQYTSDKIRNVAVVGHGNAGKTTLIDAMLWQTKNADRFGKVDDGTSVSDYDPEEIKRKTSVFSTVVSFDTGVSKFNVLDTPGLFDYEGAVAEMIPPAESVLIVISGKSGLSVGAEKGYEAAKKAGKATMFYISKMDRENADFYKIFEDLKAKFGPSVCPFVVPAKVNGKNGYIDLVDEVCYVYDGSGSRSWVDMPDMGHRIAGLRTAMIESAAAEDEELFEKYLEGEEITREEVIKGIKNGIKNGNITPVICGSALQMEAVDLVIEALDVLLPAANAGVAEAENAGEIVELACDENGPFVAQIFKTINDPFVGKLSFVKVVSGKLNSSVKLYNASQQKADKIGKLLFVCGKKTEETKEIAAGDIGAITKLSNAATGDTLCAEGASYVMEAINFPRPTLRMSISPANKGEESKVGTGMNRLCEEDKTLWFGTDAETKQQIVTGMGEQHIDVVVSRLKSKYGVDVVLEQPMVAYREKISKKVTQEGRHKKQTGGHGQFGHVVIEFEPYEGDELLFEENVFGGAVPKGYFPAVEKGLLEASASGVIAGYPMVGLKATLTDGSYHPVDSSEMAFKLAANLAYKEGIKQAKPFLLEPIGALKATVPEDNTGDIMGEINKRRGRVLGMIPLDGGKQIIEAEVPMATMHDFTTFVRSTTGGRGVFSFDFVRYEPLPPMLEAKVVEEAKKFFDKE